MKGFLYGLVVGALCLWGLERVFAPTTDYTRALERNELALVTVLKRQRLDVAHDTVRVTKLLADWPTLRGLFMAAPTAALPSLIPLRRDIILWGDSLAVSCNDLKRDATAALSTSAALIDNRGEQRDAYKSIARGAFLHPSLSVLGSLAPSAKIEGELAAGRTWQVMLRGTLEADTSGFRRRLEFGVRRSFHLF